MKRLTESQIRQVIREELVGLLNEISPFEKGPYGIGVKRTPEELKADFVPQWNYDPNAPIVDPRFRSEPMDVLESYQAFSFFNKLEKPFYELKKIFQIDDNNNFEVSFIRSLNSRLICIQLYCQDIVESTLNTFSWREIKFLELQHI